MALRTLARKDPFSTDETLTERTWLGKPVFRKVIDFGALPNAAAKSVAHGITGETQFIDAYVVLYSGLHALRIPYADPTPANCISMYVDVTNVVIGAGNNRSASRAYAVLEYIKN
ncbi:MAG TPA: hypothetical protein VN436_05350 [Holophaga sp.]|nr:hypothetical protein [Holophaga sp.]